MDHTSRAGPGVRNHLIAALPPADRGWLLARMEQVTTELRQDLYTPGEPIRHVYFPLTTVNSLLVRMEDGQLLEFGTVGNEGFVGLPAFLGAPTPVDHAMCQVPGEVLRLTVEDFRVAVLETDGPLYRLLHRYTQALFVQTAQGSACNRLHVIEQRFCRWMLMTHDRVGRDQFPMTHEFLSQMLGVRRATVSEAAATVQERGLIRYHRGTMEILDRAGLEAASCECYRVIRNEYDRMTTLD